MGGTQSHDVNYCYAVPNSKLPGFTPVFRNPKYHQKLIQSPNSSIRTYRDVILERCSQNFPNKNLFGKIVTKKQAQGEEGPQREIHHLTSKQVLDKAQLLGKAILGYKLQFAQKIQGMRFIGIYAKNCIEWVITDFACTLFGLTSVPLYDTLGLQNLSYCLNQTEMTTLFLSEATLKSLLSLKDFGKLKNVVVFQRINQQNLQKANNLGLSVIDFNSLIQEGLKFPNINYKDFRVQPGDIYTFSYTSGTTGPPKGAMLCHRNITAFLFAVINLDLKFFQTDVHLSFLPLPHVFERIVVTALVYLGCQLVFYGGNMLKLKDDCQLVKPTVFPAVPRIFNKIVEKTKAQFDQKTGISKLLIENAVDAKMENLQKEGTLNHDIYDPLVFSKVKQAFGGRIRLMISGSAPLSQQNYLFMEMIMSAPMYEAYGQTQNTGLAFLRSINDIQAGKVGGVISNLQFKLADIPEMNYTSEDKDQNGKSAPRGQIWLRGPPIFSGYYKLKQKTEEAITKDGWLKTGDVGVLLACGRMKIIDRKKNIFKLQQGEYVAPEKVQNIYRRCPLVEEVFLYGQSLQNYCVGIIKPEKQNFLKFAKQKNLSGSYEQLCRRKDMKLHFIRCLFELGKKQGLNTFEQAKNVYLQSSSFADKKILTNTLKLQRFQAKNVYQKEIHKLYEQGELPVK